MPKRSDEVNKSENIKIRLTPETRQRCNNARLRGARKNDTESSFMGFLVELGIAKYEKAILPLERSDDETATLPNKKEKVS